jgi:hypothetical protein
MHDDLHHASESVALAVRRGDLRLHPLACSAVERSDRVVIDTVAILRAR